MTTRLNILNCPIDVLTMDETVACIDHAIRAGKTIRHSCVYASKLAMMHSNQGLFDAVTSSDLINNESQLIVWLSRLYGPALPERVVGLELFEHLVSLAHRRGYRIFCFGARDDIVARVVDIYSTKYSPTIIAGYRNGYYQPDEEEAIARGIAESGADMLFVAISSPTKELFLKRYADILQPITFQMGVGGSFDVIAGRVRRAPQWMQRMALEWLFRFLQEPRDKWKTVVVDSFLFLWYLVGQAVRRTARGRPRSVCIRS